MILGHSCIRHSLISLKFEQLTTKILEWCSKRQNSIEFWAKNIKEAFKKTLLLALKIKKENVISGLSKRDFWQSLIAPEAQKERSCQSFSASHIRSRADCPFHRPAFFRPGLTVCPSVRLPVSQSLNQSFSQPAYKPASQSISQLTNHQWIHSVSQSFSRRAGVKIIPFHSKS